MSEDKDTTVEGLLIRDTTPLPAELATFFSWIRYFVLVWTVKIVIAIQLFYLRTFHPVTKPTPAGHRYQSAYLCFETVPSSMTYLCRCTSAFTAGRLQHATP